MTHKPHIETESLPGLDSRSLAWIDNSVQELRLAYDLGNEISDGTLLAAVDKAQDRIERRFTEESGGKG